MTKTSTSFEVERRRVDHLELERHVGLAVPLAPDRPGVHLRRHVAERRDLPDLVEILLRRVIVRLGDGCVQGGHGCRLLRKRAAYRDSARAIHIATAVFRSIAIASSLGPHATVLCMLTAGAPRHDFVNRFAASRYAAQVRCGLFALTSLRCIAATGSRAHSPVAAPAISCETPPGGRRMTETARDKPWLFRTYAGHSTAAASNALYRANLARGQTGLSVAFDLPTQTGYDSDHPLARGEVGKVGVPVCHLGDMRALFDGIPLEAMNTSMTINATAAWLLALYVAAAEEQGADVAKLQGTVQNDIIKEYLSRGTYVFPPEPSLKLIADVAAVLLPRGSEVEPDERLQLPPAGGRRDAGAGARLRARHRPRRPRRGPRARSEPQDFPELVCRISFFVNAGIRFVTEMCKMRAFVDLWDEICRDALRRRRPEAPPLPLRRAGQLARPDRAAAGEQRLPHPDRDARRRPLEERPRPRRAAPGLERGARPAAPLGPAVVAPHAADHGLRDRPARIRRPLRRQPRRRPPRSRS